MKFSLVYWLRFWYCFLKLVYGYLKVIDVYISDCSFFLSVALFVFWVNVVFTFDLILHFEISPQLFEARWPTDFILLFTLVALFMLLFGKLWCLQNYELKWIIRFQFFVSICPFEKGLDIFRGIYVYISFLLHCICNFSIP